MTRVSITWILLLTICGVGFEKCLAKPTELIALPADPASIISLSDNVEEDVNLARDKRFPQYGFADYDDYSFGPSGRHVQNKHKHHHKPIHGGHGCRTHGHDCGSSHQKPISGGGSFASASAGSFGGGNHGGSNSQAQSASISFGPFSISTAQAQSSSKGQGGYGGYGDYGNFGGFDY